MTTNSRNPSLGVNVIVLDESTDEAFITMPFFHFPVNVYILYDATPMSHVPSIATFTTCNDYHSLPSSSIRPRVRHSERRTNHFITGANMNSNFNMQIDDGLVPSSHSPSIDSDATLDLPSESTTNDSSVQMQNAANGVLTDDEIFTTLDTLDHTNLLQIAKTHRTQEIVERWNVAHPDSQRTEASISKALGRAYDTLAKRQGRTRAELKKVVSDARNTNGVIARTYGAIVEKTQTSKKRKREDPNVSRASAPPTPTSTQTASTHTVNTLRAQRGPLLTRPLGKIANGELLSAAEVFTNFEIIAKINGTLREDSVTSQKLSNRLIRACKAVAEKEGKTAQAVRAELDAKKKQYGTDVRAFNYTAAQRAASQAAKRNNQNVELDEDTDMVDAQQSDGESSDGEDPLGDLETLDEQIVRQADGEHGQAAADDLNGHPSSVAPFRGIQVGHLAGTPAYLPGSRLLQPPKDQGSMREHEQASTDGTDALPSNVAPFRGIAVGHLAGTPAYLPGFRLLEPPEDEDSMQE